MKLSFWWHFKYVCVHILVKTKSTNMHLQYYVIGLRESTSLQKISEGHKKTNASDSSFFLILSMWNCVLHLPLLL